jgi:hypothetical protein
MNQLSKDIAAYSGCQVISCSNKIKPPREKANYTIRDFCRHHQSGKCPFERNAREQDTGC